MAGEVSSPSRRSTTSSTRPTTARAIPANAAMLAATLCVRSPHVPSKISGAGNLITGRFFSEPCPISVA
jgi:hypothetical protein